MKFFCLAVTSKHQRALGTKMQDILISYIHIIHISSVKDFGQKTDVKKKCISNKMLNGLGSGDLLNTTSISWCR